MQNAFFQVVPIVRCFCTCTSWEKAFSEIIGGWTDFEPVFLAFQETCPRSPNSRTLRRVSPPRWRWIALEWSAFHRKEWLRQRVRYKSDAISKLGAWPLSTDREHWFGFGKFLPFSFHKVSILNWNFSQCFLFRLVEMTSPLLGGLSGRKLCQKLIQQVWVSENKHPHPTPTPPLPPPKAY